MHAVSTGLLLSHFLALHDVVCVMSTSPSSRSSASRDPAVEELSERVQRVELGDVQAASGAVLGAQYFNPYVHMANAQLMHLLYSNFVGLVSADFAIQSVHELVNLNLDVVSGLRDDVISITKELMLGRHVYADLVGALCQFAANTHPTAQGGLVDELNVRNLLAAGSVGDKVSAQEAFDIVQLGNVEAAMDALSKFRGFALANAVEKVKDWAKAGSEAPHSQQ